MPGTVIQLRFSDKKFRAMVKKAPGLLRQTFTQALNDIGNGFVAEMKETRLSGPPGLQPRTGVTRRSLTHQVGALGAAVGGGMQPLRLSIYFEGAAAKWVGGHERGITIQANGNASVCGKGRMLAIPLPAARTAAGVARSGPCNMQGLVLIKSKKGNLLLVKPGAKRKRARGAVGAPAPPDFTPMFVLKKQVRIPARLGFATTWRGYLPVVRSQLADARKSFVAAAERA